MKNTRSHFVALLLPLALIGVGCAVDPSISTGPGFRYDTPASGCGNFFLYAENSSGTEALVVQGDTDSLGLTTTPRTFLIEQQAGRLDLHIDFYSGSSDGNRYCSDIGGGQRPYSTWKAVRGRAEISVSDVNVPFNTPYRVTVRLYDVEFRSPDGERSATLPSLVLEDVTVGWLPG